MSQLIMHDFINGYYKSQIFVMIVTQFFFFYDLMIMLD